ncbi:MAG: ATP-binding protein [Bacteroidota bacterium]
MGGRLYYCIAEDNGQPILPPAGLEQNQIDSIQKKILELSHKLRPQYFPIVQPYLLNNKHILVIWCPAGDNRPYEAPENLGKQPNYSPYVRVTANSIKARGTNLTRLQELAARIPFDDRVNNQATIQDFDLSLIQAYLQEVKSDLFDISTKMSLEELCRAMLIAKGPSEDLRPVNVGLLFFSRLPEKFFERAWIELVWHEDDSSKKFKEVYFKGSIQTQLRDALSFFKTNIIKETIVKKPMQAEADRFYNFPYEAIEETLSNAVYHKSYEMGSPIEIQVWDDKIEILSHPGPVPPVNAEILSTHKRIVAREYRNRRIGDFLKELRLTEGRGTGFPTIYKAMDNNGSPAPMFDTDEQNYVLVTLPAKAMESNEAGNQVKNLVFNDLKDIIAYSNGASNQASNQAKEIVTKDIHGRVAEILTILTTTIKRVDLFELMKLSNQSKNRAKFLDPLIHLGWVAMEFPEEPTHPNQMYSTTDSGMRILELISDEDN